MTSVGSGVPDGSYAENAEFWIKIIREGLDRYRVDLTDRAVLDAVGSVDGLRVLDAGCGEGYLSRLLARAGATVTGVDSCTELVVSARAAAREHDLDIAYDVARVDDLDLPTGSIDTVVANHLVDNLPDLTGPFEEFSRVLAPGGRLVVLMLHPAFYTGNRDRNTRNVFPTPDRYFGRTRIDQEFRVAGLVSPAATTLWLRPLEEHVAALSGAGFCITSIREPHPSASQLEDAWWQENFPRPLFMLVVAEKHGR